MTQKSKDIQQSQAEPYIVKSHDIHIDADYADWIVDIKSCNLFCAENMKELKQLVLVIGAELVNSKLHQPAGKLQFVVNQDIMSQAKNNWLCAYASCKRSCRRQNA